MQCNAMQCNAMQCKAMVTSMKKTEETPRSAPPIGAQQIAEAAARLKRYRMGKQALDSRMYEEEQWWRARHGSHSSVAHTGRGRPASAWLFNSVCNKHADMCDQMPTCSVLPRDPSDENAAALLSDILPVISARCGFESTYASNAWSKLKHGVAAYGVFWNPTLENGLGDIDIRRVDVMNLYWEPGVADIQESPHLYIVGLENTADLVAGYPVLREKPAYETASATDEAAEAGGSFLFGDRTAMGDKTAVVDWYYRTVSPTGKTLLHYAKFTGNTLLYASENDPAYCERGWYDHGMYPVVLDVLYPEEGTPAGYGLIAVGRNPQAYIDELDGHLLEYANWASRVRYWAKRSLGINEKDFLNPDKHIVEVEGDIDEEKLRQITLSPMDSGLSDLRRMKIEELKETTGSRDVSTGGTVGGVTAAAAISALQEAGNKTSRDCIAGSYRAYTQVMCRVIELIRQFYVGIRTFRVSDHAPNGVTDACRYVRYSNSDLQDHVVGMGDGGEVRFRRPLFDLEVRAEHDTPLDRNARNEMMFRLYESGLLAPGREVEALRALTGMEFEGIDSLRHSLTQGIGKASV